MRKITSLLTCLILLLLPLISQAGSQPSYFQAKTTWFGGPVGNNQSKIEGKTLAEISAMADQEAALSRRVVIYKTEDSEMIYKVYPSYGTIPHFSLNDLSKCRLVDSQTWRDGRLIDNENKEVCIIDYDKLPSRVGS